MNRNEIIIFLPVHNRKNITGRFIDCLLKQTYKNYHLVLIDDGSKDGTSEMVQNKMKSVTIIKGKGKWWWAGSLQEGYKWLKKRKISDNDIVVIMNDDTIFDNNFLGLGEEILIRHGKTLLGAQAYSLQNNCLIDSGVYFDEKRFRFTQAGNPEEINCLSTRGLFLYAKDFLRLGGFHPYILPHYGSDYEFTIRAHKMGMKLITDPLLKLYSDEVATGEREFKNKSLLKHIKQVFARGSVRNPIFLSMLVFFTCTWQLRIKNIYKIWNGLCKGFFQRFRRIAR